MSRALLGDTLDIHMGGIEHIPVHHTNEIAQSESATGKTFVNYWIHNEHLTVDGAKMAKSSGTSYSLSDITDKGFEPLVLRYFFLNSHYRSKQNFTWEALEAAKISLERLTSRVRELNNEKPGEIDQTTNQKFISAIEDDFNIPEALAVSWELLKSDLDDATKLATILKFDEVLGLKLSETTPRSPALLPKEALKLLDKRLDARKNKNWDLSDTLRDQLKEEFGIEVKDTEEGQVIG